MLGVATIIELRRRPESAIFAVPYRDARRLRTRRLPDGAIVEAPGSDERCHVPRQVDACLAVTSWGEPASVGHANLGLIASYLALSGIYLLPDGDVAAIYGAEACPLGDRE